MTSSIASALALLLVACSPVVPVPVVPSHEPTVVASPVPHTVCQSPKPGLPDPICQPGVIDPAVTQDNIHQTICVPGYTAKVRPPVSYTDKLKRQQMAEYGIASLSLSQVEEDHVVALEIGGHPTDPRNLWPELWEGPDGARIKDKVENRTRAEVCSGRMTLADAQAGFMTDWQALAARLGVN